MGNFFSSSIGKKLLMSVTGLFLLFFLLFHATMNVVAIFSLDAYNAICEFLGANWYALVATMILAGGFIVHILLSIVITLYNRKARGSQRYAAVTRPKKVSWASKNMFVLGVIVAGFIGLHLYQFWAKMQLVEIMGGHVNDLGFSPVDGGALMLHYFKDPLIVIGYLIWIGALWFHMTHGFWSAFQTIGWNNTVWLSRLQCAGKWLATITCLMFAAVAIYFYLSSVLCCSSTVCGL